MEASDYIALIALLISVPGTALAVFDHFRMKRDRIAQLEREYVSMIEGMTRDIDILERSVLAQSGRVRRLAAKAKYKKAHQVENSLLKIIELIIEPNEKSILNLRKEIESFPRSASPELLGSLNLVHGLREKVQTSISQCLTGERKVEEDSAYAEQALDLVGP